MTELEFGKSVDEIEAPVLIPEGWRTVELVDDPKVEPNAAFKEDPNAEKAGHNWVIRLLTADDNPAYNGRRFTLWLGIPTPKDNESYTQDGQKKYDAKMARIVKFVEAFGGRIERSKVSLAKGAKGQVYILQGINRSSGEVENSVDSFNQGFKPAGE